MKQQLIANTSSSQQRRKWPLGLCECYSYRNPKGEKRWWPTFCCTSMVCSNMMTGRLCSKVYKESQCCLQLGPMGCLICLATLPISVYSPAGGFGIFCVLSNHLRRKVVNDYNVEEEPCCTCCSPCCNSLIDYMHYGCNYPCSLFQVMMSLEHWEMTEQMQKGVSVAPIIVVPNTVVHSPQR